MYNKDEAKEIRLEFWKRFKNYSSVRRKQKGLSPKWILDKTGISQLKLKFDFIHGNAIVAIDIETRNIDKRLELFGRLEEFKSILEKIIESELTWELEYTRDNGKSISRIYTQHEAVSIYNKEDWPEIFSFFYKKMMKFESFYNQYGEILKT